MNNTAAQRSCARQWLRLILAYLLAPLLLLVCGGDPGWWQGWLYTPMILIAGIGGRIWAERRHPGLMAERQSLEKFKSAKPWDKYLAPLMAVSLVFPMVVVAGLDHRYHGSPEFPIWLNLIGFLFIASGYALATWALAENRFFSTVVRIQTERGHTLCDTGPYRFVRHPGYAGNIAPLLGIVLALNSLWALIPGVFALIITVTRTLLEDQTLQNELAGYREYAKRVRFKLIPGLF